MSNGVLSAYSNGTGSLIMVNYYRKSGGSLTARLGYERNGTNNWWTYQNMSTARLHE
ncbi:hypothetical protein [Streptomyces sp. NPDC056013]|uniref:hypothetical protein n=1 Tax=Streptomyces sp. NPDC056013 TaxID=3345680 RepID=UPI0035DD7340